MNINETLAKHFKDSYPNEYLGEIKFLCEKNPQKKYNLALLQIKDIVKNLCKEPLFMHINELYDVEKATRSLTGKRDHVIHALNTFLLGIYINDKYLDKEVNQFQWKLAALFHDIAYPLDISQKINERYFGKMNKIKTDLNIESLDPFINLVPKNFEKLTNNKNAFDYIQKKICEWGLDVNVQKRYDDMISSNKICHGMLSALTVFYLVDLMYQKRNPARNNILYWNQTHFENHVVSACSAIFLHNLPEDAFNRITKKDAPLPYLLKLCDELQSWDRPDKNTVRGDLPENYNISIENNKILFKVKGEKYLFCWDKISGKDNERMKEFLTQNLGIDWINKGKIDTKNDIKTLREASGKNFISLKLTNDKTNIDLEINNNRTDKFIVKEEKRKINIYYEKYRDISKKIECLNDRNIKVTNFNNDTGMGEGTVHP